MNHHDAYVCITNTKTLWLIDLTGLLILIFAEMNDKNKHKHKYVYLFTDGIN